MLMLFVEAAHDLIRLFRTLEPGLFLLNIEIGGAREGRRHGCKSFEYLVHVRSGIALKVRSQQQDDTAHIGSNPRA